MFARNSRISRSFAATLLNAAVEGATGAAAAEVKLTPAEKRAKQIDVLTKRIEVDTVKLAELKLEAETSERLASVAAGSQIVARIGRADTSKEVSAVVLGVKSDDTTGAVRYKISFGEGFDADTAVIQPTQIISVITEGTAEIGVAKTTEEIAAAALAAPEFGTDDYGRPLDANGNVIGG